MHDSESAIDLHSLATWRSGYAAACKAVYTGSSPVVALEAEPSVAAVEDLDRLIICTLSNDSGCPFLDSSHFRSLTSRSAGAGPDWQDVNKGRDKLIEPGA